MRYTKKLLFIYVCMCAVSKHTYRSHVGLGTVFTLAASIAESVA